MRILSEGGGSMGFRDYHQLALYMSEFANKTGFPKFPLKGETEMALSRFFQVVFPNCQGSKHSVKESFFIHVFSVLHKLLHVQIFK